MKIKKILWGFRTELEKYGQENTWEGKKICREDNSVSKGNKDTMKHFTSPNRVYLAPYLRYSVQIQPQPNFNTIETLT